VRIVAKGVRSIRSGWQSDRLPVENQLLGTILQLSISAVGVRVSKGLQRMPQPPLIVGLGGTTRAGSSSEKALRLALGRAADMGCQTDIVAGADVPVAMFDPAQTTRCAEAARMIALFRKADGLIVASPGYHGTISGLIKNALDYAEDTRTDARSYFDGIAMGCIAVADGPQALGSTVFALRSIAHALRAWPTPYAAMINSSTRPFAEDGTTKDELVAKALATVGEQVAEFALMRRNFVSV
jgi:FMN reductase